MVIAAQPIEMGEGNQIYCFESTTRLQNHYEINCMTLPWQLNHIQGQRLVCRLIIFKYLKHDGSRLIGTSIQLSDNSLSKYWSRTRNSFLSIRFKQSHWLLRKANFRRLSSCNSKTTSFSIPVFNSQVHHRNEQSTNNGT